MNEGGGWYHVSVRPIQRARGHSSVAAAAYISGDRLTDPTTAETHDYTRRGGVAGTGIVGWNGTAQELWSAAEQAETNKDGSRRQKACTGRKIVIALPADVDDTARQEIVARLSEDINQRWGVAVHFAIHRPDTQSDQRNHHAHFVITDRVSDGQKLSSKARSLTSHATRREELNWLRRSVAERINEALDHYAPAAARVDHRSFASRGIDRRATRHDGPAGRAALRRRMRRAATGKTLSAAAAEIAALAAGDDERDDDPLALVEQLASGSIKRKAAAEFLSGFSDGWRLVKQRQARAKAKAEAQEAQAQAEPAARLAAGATVGIKDSHNDISRYAAALDSWARGRGVRLDDIADMQRRLKTPPHLLIRYVIQELGRPDDYKEPHNKARALNQKQTQQLQPAKPTATAASRPAKATGVER